MKSIVVTKAIIFNEKGRLLALRRSDTDDRRPLQWDLPGGWVDEGEDVAEAMSRELHEEAGLTTNPQKLQLVFTKNAIKKPKEELINVNWLFFIGQVERKTIKLSYEHCEARWMSIDEALKEFKYDIQLELLKHVKHNRLIPEK
jgi:8-oxo-dGTP pyrophosphatase MutT (NUDIX family)